MTRTFIKTENNRLNTNYTIGQITRPVYDIT